jgi:hypothetical protein
MALFGKSFSMIGSIKNCNSFCREKLVSESLKWELETGTATNPVRLQKLSDNRFACVPINGFPQGEAVFQNLSLCSEQTRIETTSPDPL